MEATPTISDQVSLPTAAPLTTEGSSNQVLQSFLREVAQPIAAPVLKTSVKKSATEKAPKAPATRRKGSSKDSIKR
jgi:hypothetical protein